VIGGGFPLSEDANTLDLVEVGNKEEYVNAASSTCSDLGDGRRD
jgi:hypothetical protein